jgi:hypothetical protein
VNVQLDVLSSLVMNRIVREINNTDVVAEYDTGLVDVDVQLGKKVPQPATFSSGIGNPSVLSFGRGTGDNGLALRGPRYECLAKKNAEARGGPLSIRAACPVGVSVRRERGGARRA